MKRLLQIILSLSIVLCPLYILRADVFIPTTLLEWLIGLSVVLSAVDFFRTKTSVDIFKSSLNWIIGLFLLSAIVAVATSVDRVGGLGILKAYFIEPVLFYYCLLYLVKKYGGEDFILKSLLICGIWLSLLALVQGLTGKFSLAPNEIIQGRVSAVYNSANSLALFLGPLVMLSAALFLSEKRRRKFFMAGLFVFFTIIMIWTRSRGGLIAELFSLLVLVYSVLAKGKSFLRRIWVIVPIIIIGVIAFFLIQTIQTYQSMPKTAHPYIGADTLEIRYYLWQGSVNLLSAHPIFGAGLDGFKTLYVKYKLPQYPEDFQYPHNIILTFWSEMGIFGLVVFLGLVIKLYQMLISTFPKSKNFYISAALLAALTYWLVHGVVDVPYFKNDLSFEFWVFVALIEIWTARSERS